MILIEKQHQVQQIFSSQKRIVVSPKGCRTSLGKRLINQAHGFIDNRYIVNISVEVGEPWITPRPAVPRDLAHAWRFEIHLGHHCLSFWTCFSCMLVSNYLAHGKLITNSLPKSLANCFCLSLDARYRIFSGCVFCITSDDCKCATGLDSACCDLMGCLGFFGLGCMNMP